MIVIDRDTRRKPDENDERICSGCHCFIVASNYHMALGETCHGTPEIKIGRNKKHLKAFTCPCKACLIKSMCREPCDKYETFKLLSHGIISEKQFLKGYKNA